MGRGSYAGGVEGGRARAGSTNLRLGRRTVSGSDMAGVARELSTTAWPDPEQHAKRLESIRQAFREGKRISLEPIRIGVDQFGRTSIADGRHRLKVMQEPEFRHVRQPAVFFRSGRRRK